MTSGNTAALIGSAVPKKTVRTGHNHYQAYFPKFWNTPNGATPIDRVEMWETTEREEFNLEDLTEDSWYPKIWKYSGIRIIVNWDIGVG